MKELSKEDFHQIMTFLMNSKMEKLEEDSTKEDGSFEQSFSSDLRTYHFGSSYTLDITVTVRKDKVGDAFSYSAKVGYFLGSNEMLDFLQKTILEGIDFDSGDIKISPNILDEEKRERKKFFELTVKVYSFNDLQKAIRMKKDVVSLVDRMFTI